MNLAVTNHIRRQVRQRALTLLELMVAISVLTIIIFGLYSMFDRTQKAFLETTTQKDVLEGGRNFMEMMVRDLEQMHAANIYGRTNLYIHPIVLSSGNQINGFRQNSMVGSNLFTNLVQEFFFLTKTSQWTGIAYYVGQTSTNYGDEMLYTNLGVGTLRRYSYTTNDYYHNSSDLFANYYTNNNPNAAQLVADGVIHLALRAYDSYGSNVDTSNYSFTNTFLPAYLELEVGVLEPKVLLQARSMPNPSVQRAFLQETTNRSSAVHIFRTRIPVRNAN
ncbi:MAG TPA: type II secretion system protein [Verrucomicrobiae bacterium]